MDKIIRDMEETVAEQTANIGVLADSLEHLSLAIEDRPTKGESRRFSILLNLATLLVLGTFIIIMLGQVTANNDAIKGSKESIKRSEEVLKDLEDCITEDGDCYERSQARTGEAVKVIVCRMEVAIARGYETAGLPPYELSPECR